MVKARGSSRFRRRIGVVGVVLGLLLILVVLALLAAIVLYGREGERRAEAPAPPPPPVPAGCDAPGYGTAAAANAASLRNLPITTFRRVEAGWETYAPLVAREIGARCPPHTAGFAAALARWQTGRGLPGGGVLGPDDLQEMKGLWQERRPFVMISSPTNCPPPPNEAELALVPAAASYGGKTIQLRRRALQAYTRMAAAARAESSQIAADPRNLTIFSGYRSPDYDAARCLRDNNCDGLVRASCSPHRTGLALDLYVGQAPGFGPDSTADANRLAQSRGPAYRWLVANAQRFGFVNYPFEPWHWEWTGEAP
jgi:zinc D-Ala-D-Ala carboxypeptidase